ncbi:MAG: carbon-nitrogen hydrolase family protein [Ktedonobacteraceae bacterium]|nr:carbon-nitrogen hydrolase family protein [Ktedonobacteraceae bacterium]
MLLPVVAAQFPVTFNVRHNLQEILSFLQQTQQDELLILPEGALSGYADDPTFLSRLDTSEIDAAIDTLTEVVYQKRVHLVVGSCLFEDDVWWNTGIYFSPQGTRFVYRKVNLAMHERVHFSAGSELPVFPVQREAGSINIGIQLCREIRFPEQWLALAMQKADLLIYLTNATNPQGHLSVWRSHLVSRAAENQRFVVSANVAHLHQHCPTCIIAPSGQVLQEHLSPHKAMLRQTLDLTQNSNWYLSQRRSDIVATLLTEASTGKEQ